MRTRVPMRGTGTAMKPTDPLIYRFFELVLVNGPTRKALIEGGKFLPLKYYGATGNALAYALKEE